MEIKIKTAAEFRDAHVTIEIRTADETEAALVAERLYTAREVGDAQASEAELVSTPLRRRIAELEDKVRRADSDRRAEYDRNEGLSRRNAELVTELAVSQENEREIDRRRQAAWNKATELETELERYRKAHVCTSRCSENSHVAFEGNRIVKDLETELAARVVELKAQDEEHLEVYAALQAKIREHVQSIQARDRLLREATEEASQARSKVIEIGESLVVERERANESRDWAERAEGRLASAGLKLADAERAIQLLSGQLGKISGAVYSPEVATVLGRVIDGWEFRTLADSVRKVRDALGSPSSPAEPTSQA